VWLSGRGQAPGQEIEPGLAAASKALSLQEGWARAMVTRARLLLEKSLCASDPGTKRNWAQQAAADLKKALDINANLTREIQPLLDEAARQEKG
jgi:hypothetical protein